MELEKNTQSGTLLRTHNIFKHIPKTGYAMVLYMIGLGLWDAKDITLKGLEAVKNSDYVYLENYTSKLGCRITELEKLYGKKIILADRELVESGTDEILDKAKNGNVAFLVIGDPFGATTHTSILLRAEKKGIRAKTIHNASIINAIGITGLELYKFGRTTSIPFDNRNVRSPFEVYEQNQKAGLHTLFLLDLKPGEKRFMTVSEAVSFLIRTGLDKDKLCVGCAGIGSEKPEIRAGKAYELLNASFSLIPQCLVIPARLHFIEEEALGRYR